MLHNISLLQASTRRTLRFLPPRASPPVGERDTGQPARYRSSAVQAASNGQASKRLSEKIWCVSTYSAAIILLHEPFLFSVVRFNKVLALKNRLSVCFFFCFFLYQLKLATYLPKWTSLENALNSPCCTQHQKCLGTDHIEMLNWGVHSSFCTNLRLCPHRCLKETHKWETDLINHYSKQLTNRVETHRLIILARHPAFFHLVLDPPWDGYAACPVLISTGLKSGWWSRCIHRKMIRVLYYWR